MKPPLGTSVYAMAMRGSETPEETSAKEVVAREAVSCSSLASLLLCSEAAPSIMEHEKALLIAKEHDYAKTPNDYGLVQLTPLILQQIEKENCEAENFQAPRNEQNSEARRKVRSLVKKELLECHQTLLSGRRELLRESETGIPGHLRELVAMQASLINTLQEQLHVREVELSTVRREKEQLEARLARMDRRLNILQKRSKDKEEQGNDSEGAAVEHPDTGGRVRHRKPSSLSHLSKADATPTTHSRPARSRSSSVDHSKTRVHSSSACLSPSNLETTPKTMKRGPSEESNHSTSSKRSRQLVDAVTEMRTETDYFGIDIDSLFPPVCYETEEGDGSVDTGGNQEIRIPSWRIEKISTTSCRNSTITEDISDEVFQKRHSKPENEEKRRKRWDAQRIRRQCQYEHLLKKYMMKEGSLQTPERKKEKIVTILPKLDQIEAIEISDTVIVSAFGRPLPALPPSTFSLPGFDPAAKEVSKPSARTRTRNRPSSNTTGAGGGGTGKD